MYDSRILSTYFFTNVRCMKVCICLCVRSYVEARGGRLVSCSVLLPCCSLSLDVNLINLIRVASSWDLPVSTPQDPRVTGMYGRSCLLCGCWDWNSGPCACVAGPLPHGAISPALMQPSQLLSVCTASKRITRAVFSSHLFTPGSPRCPESA